MKKLKRHIVIPLLLLIYLAVIAYFTHPSKNSELSYTQYYVTIGITLVILIALSFFLKKKADNEKKWKDLDKNQD